LIAAKNNFLTLKLYKDTLWGYNFIIMKKYVGPMGCVKPQDQPVNCPECGMKLLPTDGLGFETDQFGLTTTDQFGFETDKKDIK
jgi:hypothetical protein